MTGRKYLSASDLRDLLERQGGLCASWGCESEGPFEADHHIPNAWEPGKPSQLLCIPCHKAKTRRDVKAIAKVKRLNGTTSSQWSRRENAGGSRIKGAGFKGWRRMNGEVVRNDR